MNKIKIAFIGGGHMCSSLVTGLLANHWPAENIRVSDPNPLKRQSFIERGIHCSLSNLEAVEQAEVIVLAVKPQHIKPVCLELKTWRSPKPSLVLSIAAGIRCEQLRLWLPEQTAIVRVMPNTAALLGLGASGLYANGHVTETQHDLAESLMRAVGVTVWLPHEHDLDTVTALSGSGPAYFFLILEHLQNSAQSLGLSKDTARLLTLQTALGAIRMALASEQPLSALRQQVTSKGGTTERALAVLEDQELGRILKEALYAARDRAIELSKETENL